MVSESRPFCEVLLSRRAATGANFTPTPPFDRSRARFTDGQSSAVIGHLSSEREGSQRKAMYSALNRTPTRSKVLRTVCGDWPGHFETAVVVV